MKLETPEYRGNHNILRKADSLTRKYTSDTYQKKPGGWGGTVSTWNKTHMEIAEMHDKKTCVSFIFLTWVQVTVLEGSFKYIRPKPGIQRS